MAPRGQYWLQTSLTPSLINGLHDGAEGTLTLVNDTKAGGAALRPGHHGAIPRDLGRLERGADWDLI